MIEKIISWSTHNRFFVWIGILLIVVSGVWSALNTPVDAIPDLSENQVIVYTEWMGRNPQIIEDQITSTLFVLIVLPIVYQLVKEHEVKKHGKVKYLELKD